MPDCLSQCSLYSQDQPFFQPGEDAPHNLDDVYAPGVVPQRAPSPIAGPPIPGIEGECQNTRFRNHGLTRLPAKPKTQSVVVKREPSPDSIGVKIKQEGYDDIERQVYFTKSEDGKLDIWDLSRFDLGSEIKVDEQCRNVAFTRKNISDVSQRDTVVPGSSDVFSRLLVEATKSVSIIGTAMQNFLLMRRRRRPPKKHNSKIVILSYYKSSPLTCS